MSSAPPTPVRKLLRLLSAALAVAGCNAVLGIDDPRVATPAAQDGGPDTGLATTDGGARPCALEKISTDLGKDSDGDGYPLRYDCNECDPNVNRGAFDVPGNGIDEDCSGTADDEPANCDASLTLASADPFDGAKAIGLCKKAADAQMWGVVSAAWVKPDGSPQTEPLGQGILSSFGANATAAGARMLAISSGTARGPLDPDYQDVAGWSKGYMSGTPAGYPKVSPACAATSTGNFGDGAHDGAALKVTIRVPSNARSFKFQQNLFTLEFPTSLCADHNDFLVTIMDPKPPKLPEGNIAFDQDGNPITVNTTFLQVCKPQTAGGKTFACPLGDASLAGTGFEDHAATGWLTTTAPVDTLRGKEITLTWAIWDQADGLLDSTALIDDFRWSVDTTEATRTVPSVPK